MRDCLNNRGGFDRVLMAVAAAFLTVSATSAMAQDPSRATPAELAIDAAVPRPEPANVPPPSAGDFKTDATASAPDATKATDEQEGPDADHRRALQLRGRWSGCRARSRRRGWCERCTAVGEGDMTH